MCGWICLHVYDVISFRSVFNDPREKAKSSRGKYVISHNTSEGVPRLVYKSWALPS